MSKSLKHQTKYKTEVSVQKRALELVACRKDLASLATVLGVKITAKSGFGDIVEAWYGVEKNSRPEPDLAEVGIELKATPIEKIKKGYHAKERLICNMINYEQEAKTDTFEESAFLKKCAKMQLFFYEYIKNKNRLTYQIHWTFLMNLRELPQKDWATIVCDWNKIHTKIMRGLAHEISGADTNYLEACTKGASSASLRTQPFSSTLAKQRAFALKTSYMTVYFNRYVLGQRQVLEPLQKDNVYQDLESYVHDMVAPYQGKTEAELCDLFDIDITAKNHNASIVKAIFKLELDYLGDVSKRVEEFCKANIKFKTIRLKRGGAPKEAMSFPSFKAAELVAEEDWEESALYDMLTETRYCFVVFRCNDRDEYVFDKCFFWNMPQRDLVHAKVIWEHTKKVLKSKCVYLPQKDPTKARKTRFMGMKDNEAMHVRPHGTNKDDVDTSLPGLTYTKHCFWFNQRYIKKVIETHE